MDKYREVSDRPRFLILYDEVVQYLPDLGLCFLHCPKGLHVLPNNPDHFAYQELLALHPSWNTISLDVFPSLHLLMTLLDNLFNPIASCLVTLLCLINAISLRLLDLNALQHRLLPLNRVILG